MTIARISAKDFGWEFYTGDTFHPLANITKMSQGIPLSDENREPWLTTLKQLIQSLIKETEYAVIACSALKQAYRAYLSQQHPRIAFVFLKGSQSLIRQRVIK